MTTIVRNAAWVVAWDQSLSRHVYLQDADLVFRDDRIIQVGGHWSGRADNEIDGGNLLVTPGLVSIRSQSIRASSRSSAAIAFTAAVSMT